MTNRQRLMALLLVLLAAPWANAGIDVTVSVIADDTTLMPGSGGTRFRFLAPPATDGATVAFAGGSAGSLRGIYALSQGTLVRVADNTQLAPGTGSAFAAFGLPAVGSAAISFIGRPVGGGTGIYQSAGGSLTELLGPTDPLPGRPNPRDLGSVAGSGATLIVQGLGVGPSFVHRLLPGPAELLAIAGQAAPNGGVLAEIQRATTDGVGTSFLTGFSGEARRALMLVQGGNLGVIAEPGTVLPNGQVETLQLAASQQSHAGGRIAFFAKPIGLPVSIYQWENGQITLLVAGTSSPSGDGEFDFDFMATLALADNGTLAFVGQSGLWIQSGSQLVKVLDTSVIVNGRRLTGFALDPDGISNSIVAVKAILDDGSETLLRLDYTVTPSAASDGGGGGAADGLTLLLVGLLIAYRRNWRAAIMQGQRASGAPRI